MVGISRKAAATVLGAEIGAYAVEQGVQMLDMQIPTSNIWLKPSSVLKIGGGIGLPLIALLHKKGSENAKLAEVAAGGYYLTRLIDMARTMMISMPLRIPRPGNYQTWPKVPVEGTVPVTGYQASMTSNSNGIF